MSSNKHAEFGIIGGGPSGLVASLFLDGTSDVLEKSKSPGGHSSSFQIDGFTFDYGPHIMFSRDKEILQFMIDSLGENVHQCRRNNKISYKNRLLKYPFENDLKSLPIEDNYRCIKGFLFNQFKEKYSKPANLKEWLLMTFGEGICETYLFPYNEKIWNLPVEDLSMLWADRIPNPPPEDVLKSSVGLETEGYLHQLFYHYPKEGGYQAICDAWAQATHLIPDFNVKKIERIGDSWAVTSSKGETRVYQNLISTMPIHSIPSVLAMKIPDRIQESIDKLIVNPMFVISLGIRGVDNDQMTAIYFPESEFPVNRISYPTTFSPFNSPQGHYSVQAEWTCRPDSAAWNYSDDDVLEQTVSGLLSRGIIRSRSDIVLSDVKRCAHSYVVYDREYLKNVQIVRDWFDEIQLTLLGRFSYFEYVNVDGAIDRAQQIVGKINKNTKDKKSLLDKAQQKIKSKERS